jgi:hypothetical protein
MEVPPLGRRLVRLMGRAQTCTRRMAHAPGAARQVVLTTGGWPPILRWLAGAANPVVVRIAPVRAGSVAQMSGTSQPSLAIVVQQVLSSRGPMTEDEMLDVLAADGIDLGPDPEDTLAEILDEDCELVMPLADERWAWIPALLDGRVFTHRLSALEAEFDMIGFGPDLAPLSLLTESQTYQRLTDGSPLADVSPLFDGDVLAERGVPEIAVGDDGRCCWSRGVWPPWASGPVI